MVMPDYRKILVHYVRGVLENEGVFFAPAPGLTPTEMKAWAEAVLEAGVNDYGREELQRWL